MFQQLTFFLSFPAIALNIIVRYCHPTQTTILKSFKHHQRSITKKNFIVFCHNYCDRLTYHRLYLLHRRRECFICMMWKLFRQYCPNYIGITFKIKYELNIHKILPTKTITFMLRHWYEVFISLFEVAKR